jgi:hypothetical protein
LSLARAKHGERGIQAGNVAKVLIGIGAILIAITRMMKGLVINFELSAPAANVMLLLTEVRGIVCLNLHD